VVYLLVVSRLIRIILARSLRTNFIPFPRIFQGILSIVGEIVGYALVTEYERLTCVFVLYKVVRLKVVY